MTAPREIAPEDAAAALRVLASLIEGGTLPVPFVGTQVPFSFHFTGDDGMDRLTRAAKKLHGNWTATDAGYADADLDGSLDGFRVSLRCFRPTLAAAEGPEVALDGRRAA